MLRKSLITGIIRTRSSILSLQSPKVVVRYYRMQGPPQPFDNLPFTVPNRYAATTFFVVFFGIGFWAPFVVLWYQMAKRTIYAATTFFVVVSHIGFWAPFVVLWYRMAKRTMYLMLKIMLDKD